MKGTRSDYTPDAGSILFSDSDLREVGQDGQEDEVFDEDASPFPFFTENYPNTGVDDPDFSGAYRACIDTDHQNFFLDASEYSDWYFELRGWTYSDNLGWLSFNCEDWSLVTGASASQVCLDTQATTAAYQEEGYRTVIDVFGFLHGYAWSTKVGWIQFDFDIASCFDPLSGDYLYNDDPTSSCYRDEFYYQQTLALKGEAESIPFGRAYDNLTGRDDTLPPGSLNPAGGQSPGGIGKFYGYAWNLTLGWFDFTDSFGVEDSFAPSGGYGEVWHPGITFIESRIVNSKPVIESDPEVPYFYDNSDIRGSVVADGIDEYKVQIRILDVFGNPVSASQIDALDFRFQEFLDTTDRTQLDLSPSSSIKILYPDGTGRSENPTGQYKEESDGYLTLMYIRSFAPTSNMNGFDFNNDGILDVVNDENSQVFSYEVSNVTIVAADFSDDFYTARPLVDENVFFHSDGLPVSLKFRPAISLDSISQDSEYFINTSRGQKTNFQLQLTKRIDPIYADFFDSQYIRDFVLDLTLDVDGMVTGSDDIDYISPSEIFPNDNAPFHFVFDMNDDGFYEYGSGIDSFQTTLDTNISDLRPNGLSVTEVNAFNLWMASSGTEIIDIVAVPVLQPGASADERVQDPEIRSQMSYDIDTSLFGFSDGILPISYKNFALSPDSSESIYNPVIDVRSGQVRSSDIVNVQSGIQVVSIGDLRTDVARNFLYEGLKKLSRGKSIDPGKGYVIDSGRDEAYGGVTLIDKKVSDEGTALREVYFFTDDVFVSSLSGIPDPANGNYSALSYNTPRTIVTEGGNIFVDANLYGGAPIGLIAFRSPQGAGGNIYIHSQVTNIRAALYADNVITRYDGNSDNISTDEFVLQKDIDGDTFFSRVFSVPNIDQLVCPSTNIFAQPEDVLRHQFLFSGVWSASQNTIGGTDSVPPRIGTGETLSSSQRAKEVAKEYDLNYFTRFKTSFERDSRGYIKDQQCNAWCREDGTCYDAVTEDIVTDCLIEEKPLSEGGDLVTGTSQVCGDNALADTVSLGVSQNYAPIILFYEAPQVPLFEFAISDTESSTQVNR
ncbi:hypothetical protein HYV56_00130 [Candidatus Peregrinibacteria bacterium]|nr:hypothetical protein [Candidatus Peregrinibacteria bacterium]